jgi:serine/threonine-protein kinase
MVPEDTPAIPPSRLVSQTDASQAGLPELRRLRRALGGDLDSIVLKSLRPEPHRRYRSAQLLADDLGRYLDGAPVTAQTDALSYRAGKFVRRHKAGVLGATLALVALIGGATASLQQARVARAERDHALREAKRTAQVTAFLQDVFASARPQRQGRGVTVVEAIDTAIMQIDSSFAGDPDLRASIKLTLGSTLNDMFLYQRARPLLEDAYRLRHSLDGDQPSKEQADALYDLANIEAQIGSAAQAESLYRVSLSMLGRLPSPDSADIWEGMSNVAEAQLNQGRVAEAAALYDSVARALDRLRPADLETRGITRANRGTALAQLGRTVEAETVLREAVGLFERARGPEDARVASALQPLAGTLILNRKYAEAESVARKAVRIDEREFGPANPATLSALRMVTGAMVEAGRCDGAVPELRRMLALRGKELSETDPTLGTVLLQLGQCQAAASQLTAAEATLRDALQVRRKALGEDHWAVGQVQSVLGEVLVREKRFEEGRRLLQAGYDGLLKGLGQDHLRTREAAERLRRAPAG